MDILEKFEPLHHHKKGRLRSIFSVSVEFWNFKTKIIYNISNNEEVVLFNAYKASNNLRISIV